MITKASIQLLYLRIRKEDLAILESLSEKIVLIMNGYGTYPARLPRTKNQDELTDERSLVSLLKKLFQRWW